MAAILSITGADTRACVLWRLKHDKKYMRSHPGIAKALEGMIRSQKDPLHYGNAGQRRKARQEKLLLTLSNKQWEFIKYAFNDRCCYCGKKRPLTKDHYIALAEGGATTHRNVIPVCRKCNSSKGTNGAMYWFRKQPFYNYKRELMIRWMLDYGK
jgi:hypothetical protein